MAAVQQAAQYILEGFDPDDVNNANWVRSSHATIIFEPLTRVPKDNMFPPSAAFTQQFQTSIQGIFRKHGIPDNVLPIDYSSVHLSFPPALVIIAHFFTSQLQTTVEDRDTVLLFFKRLILSIIILNLTVNHLMVNTRYCDEKGPNPEFESVLQVRWGSSRTKLKWYPATELRSAIKLLNMYVKVRASYSLVNGSHKSL